MRASCTKMCPDSELPEHYAPGLISLFEVDPATKKFSSKLAIKKYHRSVAEQRFDPENVRTLDTLVTTVNYIIHNIIEPSLKNDMKSKISAYYYVRDRLRSIKSDMVIQEAHGSDVISILEICVVYFIWAGVIFSHEDEDIFDPVQNNEQLSDYLILLIEEYKLTEFITQNAGHFIKIFIATQFTNKNFSQTISQYIELFNMDSEIMLHKSFLLGNMTDFLNIVKSIDLLSASAVCENDFQFYINTMDNLRQGYKQFPFPESILTEYMEIPKFQLSIWKTSYNILENQGMLSFDVKEIPDVSKLRLYVIPSFLYNAFNSFDLLSTLCDIIDR